MPAELPLEQVDGFLRQAGVTSAWSIAQRHNDRASTLWSVEAHTGREALGDSLCRTELVRLELEEKDGKLDLASKSRSTQYAFAPCDFALPEDFHAVTGKVEPTRMQQDFSVIVAAIRGDKSAKVGFAEPAFRAEFAKFRRNDIASIGVEPDGHLRVCFISGLVDELGAVEELSVDVVEAKNVKVDLCGYLEVRPRKK